MCLASRSLVDRRSFSFTYIHFLLSRDERRTLPSKSGSRSRHTHHSVTMYLFPPDFNRFLQTTCTHMPEYFIDPILGAGISDDSIRCSFEPVIIACRDQQGIFPRIRYSDSRCSEELGCSGKQVYQQFGQRHEAMIEVRQSAPKTRCTPDSQLATTKAGTSS